MKVITTNLLNRFWTNGIKPIKEKLTQKIDTANLVNNGLCATSGKFALDAAYGKELTDQITQLHSDTDVLMSRSGDFYTPDYSKNNNSQNIPLPYSVSEDGWYTLFGIAVGTAEGNINVNGNIIVYWATSTVYFAKTLYLKKTDKISAVNGTVNAGIQKISSMRLAGKYNYT